VNGRRLRSLLAGPASAGLILLMLAGCLVLWLGVPLGWLWIGSQVQGSASLGTALMVTMIGVIVTIVVFVALLSWLNRRHAALREARNLPAPDYSALEVMLVVSTGLAVVLFGIWFFGFAGASPIPVNVSF
jgi:heme/copper-type cytochrome/quinol oxidase subunit 2